MADTKITALTALTAADPANDVIPIVDVSDTTMAASGTTKKISVNNILSSSPTASGALTVTGLVTAGSATITGAATVGTTLGVTGVSTFAAGTMLLPALTTTGDTNTGIYYPAADTFAVTTGGAERYRVDSSGNVGVGLTPRAKLDVNGGLLVNNYITSTNYAPLSVTTASTITTPSTFTNAINIWNPTTVGAYSNITFGYNILGLTNAPAYIGFVSTSSASGGFGDLVFGTRDVGTDTAAAERVRIDASGNLMVGVASSSNRLDIQKSTDCAVLVKSTGANTNIAMDYVSNYGNHTIRKSGTAVWDFGVINDSSATPAFKFSNGPSAVGVQLVHGATAWTALSDETVKDIIEPITNAITKVGSLRSVIGKFKTDDASKRRSFLIAQDVFAVLPEAVDVVGEKNELGVRYSDVIPLLVAAIKELSAEVNALKNA